jgi:hypothetical protein
MEKILVVGSNVELRTLAAVWFRKYVNVFMSLQSVPDFIAWARKDPGAVFSGYNAVIFVVEVGEASILSELDSFSELSVIRLIFSSQVKEAVTNLKEDSLYDIVNPAFRKSDS